MVMVWVVDLERATGRHPDPLGGQGHHCVPFIADGDPEVQPRSGCRNLNAAFLQRRDEIRSALGIGTLGIGDAMLNAFVAE